MKNESRPVVDASTGQVIPGCMVEFPIGTSEAVWAKALAGYQVTPDVPVYKAPEPTQEEIIAALKSIVVAQAKGQPIDQAQLSKIDSAQVVANDDAIKPA